MTREVIIRSQHPRADAVNYVTENGKHTLIVQGFLNAARPSGKDAMPVDLEMVSNLSLFHFLIYGSKSNDKSHEKT